MLPTNTLNRRSALAIAIVTRWMPGTTAPGPVPSGHHDLAMATAAESICYSFYGTLIRTAKAYLMKTRTCPHCGLEVELEGLGNAALCPSCYNSFPVTRSTQWPALIVPFLVIYQFMLYVL